MRIYNTLKKMITNTDSNEISDDYGLTDNFSACGIKVKLSKKEYSIWSKQYFQGSTSYKIFFNKVYNKNLMRMQTIIDDAYALAKQGCVMQETYVSFYLDEYNFIEIPFDIFSINYDISDASKRMTQWDISNRKRILKKYPEYETDN